jgi:hypothetical protein
MFEVLPGAEGRQDMQRAVMAARDKWWVQTDGGECDRTRRNLPLICSHFSNKTLSMRTEVSREDFGDRLTWDET